jgi:antitoxin (DNA-binding transcriptional repressor) of toxin-antitoxin stability system
MTLANRHELAPGEPIGPLADALTEADAGQITYLTRDGQPVAALVPIDQLTEAIRARPGPRIPHHVIEAMMDADDEAHDAMAAALDGRASEDVPPDSVRVMWEAVRARSLP